jgi:dTDP-4-amino-4,6-dideoxygalactose transaminase
MACRMLLQRYQKLINGPDISLVNTWLQKYYKTPHVYTLDSGRSGLFVLLNALGVGEGDEVIIQAYTCVVVPNAVLACGARPIYADISDKLTLDPDSLRDKITPKTKAIIVQHTFGALAPMKEIMSIAKEKNIFVIEDCAHALGSIQKNQPAGMIGDAAFLSFGRDKIVSCVRGGAIITKNSDFGEQIKSYIETLPNVSSWQLKKHLAYYPFMAIGIPTYKYLIGKFILYIAKKMHLVSRAITAEEKHGQMDSNYPTKLPNALAKILLSELSRLQNLNEHRRSIAQIYHQLLSTSNHIQLPKIESDTETILRYTIRVSDPKKIYNCLKKKHIFLGSWYDTPVAPRDTDLSSVYYTPGMCQNAEKYAAQSLNLPTDYHITPTDASYIASEILRLL